MAVSDPPAKRVPAEMRTAILAWYEERGRELPFRASRDPYAILVSEVMAQQTQISRVVRAWETFLGTFPTVTALASASPADVIRAWQGMGYNRRALNLQRAARAIVERHGGQVPREVAMLEALPGIGPYTARAVAAIAFGLPVGAVDTNVRRVLGRTLGVGDRHVQAAADASVPSDQPGHWTHALMDVGALFCRPARPNCAGCPARAWCRYAASGAAPAAAPAATAPPTVPFVSTTRWLRGRILDRLRSADADAWTEVAGPIAQHSAEAVARALIALARDGLVELDPARQSHARLATV